MIWHAGIWVHKNGMMVGKSQMIGLLPFISGRVCKLGSVDITLRHLVKILVKKCAHTRKTCADLQVTEVEIKAARLTWGVYVVYKIKLCPLLVNLPIAWPLFRF